MQQVLLVKRRQNATKKMKKDGEVENNARISESGGSLVSCQSFTQLKSGMIMKASSYLHLTPVSMLAKLARRTFFCLYGKFQS